MSRSALLKDKYPENVLIHDLWTIIDSYLGFTVYVYQKTHKYYESINYRPSWLHEVFVDIHFDFPSTRLFKLHTSIPVNVVMEHEYIGKHDKSFHTYSESICLSEETMIIHLDPDFAYFQHSNDHKSYSCSFVNYDPRIDRLVTHAIVHSIERQRSNLR